MRKFVVFFISFLLFAFSNKNNSWKDRSENASYVHQAIKQITDIMVYDIYSPPVASRTYAYISIAGYEAATGGSFGYQSFAGQLRGLKAIPKPLANQEYSAALAAVQAILAVGKTMVVSEEKLDNFHKNILQRFKETGMPKAVYEYSINYGNEVAKAILNWSGGDNYKQTRTFSKYAVSTDSSVWKPTPPAYMKAVEPHWNKIRPFLIDSAQQFKPVAATRFATDTGSEFYKEAVAVRDIGLKLTQEQKEIANFWDCNPFKMNINGHVMYASKKISPGGHWMNIARLACEKKGMNVEESLATYAYLSITIADAFICCWDEKYRSNVIRPETYINRYIDPAWMPLLQTPPFPEYTSGHSVLSNAAAIMLGKIFGEQFSFSDSTEVEFGIPVRHFTSFKQAAEEAAISRFYGGIHYMPSIINGLEEGRQIGEFMINNLLTRNKATAKSAGKN